MNYQIGEKSDRVKVVLVNESKLIAKATCFFKNTPRVQGKEIGTIGEFETEFKEAGIEILSKCEEILRNKGAELIVAPMDGNTWRKYRTLKYSNGEPIFTLENVSSIEYNQILQESGFEEIYTYTSTKGLISDCYNSKSLDILEEKLKNENIKIRKFDKQNYIDDLKKIYNISIKCFYRNPFYTEIKEAEFLKQYMNYIQMVDDDLVFIAEKQGREIGFIFCIPDFNEMKAYGKVSTIIVKTVAVLPDYERYAIGNIMLRRIAKVAKDKGFEKWIFAFMYSNNTSQKMAKRNKTELIREYALYGKKV